MVVAVIAGLSCGGIALGAVPTCAGETVEVKASGVADPRSIVLEDGRVLRLAGIEPFAVLTADPGRPETVLERELLSAVSGGPLRVRLLSEEPDRYGRVPALVAVGNTLLQEVVAREGVAVAFATGEPLPCFDRMLAAEHEARRERRGFWSGDSLPQARPEALRPRIGRFAIFEGVVVSVGNRRAVTYLNFGTWWSEDVTVEIEAADRARFGGEAALAELAGQAVRVRGFLEEKAGPMMRVYSPMQIETIPAARVEELPP